MTTLVKVVVVVVKTIVKTIVTVVCYPVVLVLTMASLVELILSIPILGPLINWSIGALVWAWSQVVGLIDAVGGLVGIRPIKHVRLHVILLMRPDR